MFLKQECEYLDRKISPCGGLFHVFEGVSHPGPTH